MQIVYSTTATSWGGRDGRAVTDDDRLDLNLSVPQEVGGDGGQGTNPEQLFAAGWSACFHSALKAVASKEKVDISNSAVSATKIGRASCRERGYVPELGG